MSLRNQTPRGAGVGAARRREARARRRALSAGTIAIVLSLLLLYVAFKSPSGIPLKPYYNVTAQFKSVGTLETAANVTIRGKLVGQVVDLRLVKGVPTVDLQMDPGTQQLPVDSTVRIRPRGLLGEEYLDITPGKSTQTIKPGGEIPASHTTAAEQLTDVFAGLTAPARKHMQQMINGLGDAVFGRGPELNETLSVAPSVLTTLTNGLSPLITSDSTPGLIANANALTAELDAVTYDFYPGMHYGAQALAPLQTEGASVTKLLEEAPADMTSIDASLATTDTVLGHLSRFSRQATQFTDYAPQALKSLTNVLVNGRRPLSSARTLLQKIQPAIKPTLAATSALSPELPYLSRLSNVASPVFNTLAPYGCDFDGFAHNWRGFLSIGVPTQTGPLGPYTILRLGVSGPGVELAGTATQKTTYHVTEPADCGIAPGS
jgi:virulence factor Mce-like protein